MKIRATSVKKMDDTPLAVVSRDGEVCMLVRVDGKTISKLQLLYSDNGIDFVPDKKKVSIKNLQDKSERIKICDRFSLSRTPNGYVMTYVREGTKKVKAILVVARSKDLYEWKIMSELPVDEFHHTTTIYDKKTDRFHLYRDGLFIKHQSSATMTVWKEKPGLVFTSRNTYFDCNKLSIVGSVVTKEGILLIYDASVEHEDKTLLQAGAVILDKNDPRKIIWRSNHPVWQGIVETKKKALPINPFGLVSLGKIFLIYWATADKGLIVVKIPALFEDVEEARYQPKILDRFKGNPIIEPRHEHSSWEGEGTFNPAVVEDDEGTIHLLYRALGRDGVSRVGYAKSKNGTYFSRRSHSPVFEPSMGFGLPDPKKAKGPIGYHPAIYTSGGGWGGAEDPRAVIIDDTLYMTYVAFEGWNSVRIALTSISVEDFKAGRWNWKKPVHLSPPGKINKNWLIFPEKIHGKFAIVHSIAPHILIDYIDDLDNIDHYIDSPRKEGPQPGRKNKWDGLLRGAGPPPIKTELGWLLLYHALDKTDSTRYKLGAMILDKDDPTKVLHRSAHPILSPDMHYENNGKPGIVYASGAVIRGDDLFIYYGGADKVVCVATTNLKEFLHYLVTGNAEVYRLKKSS